MFRAIHTILYMIDCSIIIYVLALKSTPTHLFTDGMHHCYFISVSLSLSVSCSLYFVSQIIHLFTRKFKKKTVPFSLYLDPPTSTTFSPLWYIQFSPDYVNVSHSWFFPTVDSTYIEYYIIRCTYYPSPIFFLQSSKHVFVHFFQIYVQSFCFGGDNARSACIIFLSFSNFRNKTTERKEFVS